MPPRLTEIDRLLAEVHYYLTGDEGCYFLREYTSEMGYDFSETNSIINNLKKPPTLRGTSQWYWKGEAIKQVAAEFFDAVDSGWLEDTTLVPIPPSKAEDHPEYDDRMLRLLHVMRAMRAGEGRRPRLDVRPLLRQTESVIPFHQGGSRLKPHQLAVLLEIDEDHTDPPPDRIALVDDVLTTGSHFIAARRVLTERFGEVPVVGLFVARRVFPEEA